MKSICTGAVYKIEVMSEEENKRTDQTITCQFMKADAQSPAVHSKVVVILPYRVRPFFSCP